MRIYSKDIGMGSGIEKGTMQIMKSGKRHMTEGVELRNHVVIRTLGEKETYKYLGILEADTSGNGRKILKKSILEGLESYSKQYSIAGTFKGINT